MIPGRNMETPGIRKPRDLSNPGGGTTQNGAEKPFWLRAPMASRKGFHGIARMGVTRKFPTARCLRGKDGVVSVWRAFGELKFLKIPLLLMGDGWHMSTMVTYANAFIRKGDQQKPALTILATLNTSQAN